MIILGIETSCDETAAALVKEDGTILSNIVFSQMAAHLPYGGVVPEIAARSHLDTLPAVIEQAFSDAELTLDNIDGIAVTGGPGLIGGVIVGVMTAKAMAVARDLPFLAINHLEGHALTARLDPRVEFPYLLLLMSGGHCQFLEVRDVGDYRLLGKTLDDAAGEAFDKVAKMLGFDYPGGPAIEAAALKGNPERFDLPRPLFDRAGCDFSFAGLKTAVRSLLETNSPLDDQMKADIAASFQNAVKDCLINRLQHAIASLSIPIQTLVVAGGVAANTYLRQHLEGACQKANFKLIAPPLNLCTDNAAMIAWAGIERLRRQETSPLDFEPRPRWPLEEMKAP